MHSSDVGQMGEWQVWTQLLASSQGELHVFLPTRDMGVDAIVHRLGTALFVPVQVKCRTTTDGPSSILMVRVRPDEAEVAGGMVIIVRLDPVGARLDDQAVVIPTADVVRLGIFDQTEHDTSYNIEVPWPPHPGSRWFPFVTSLEQLAERTCRVAATERPRPAPHRLQDRTSHAGFLAEMEFLRLAAGSPVLNSFHAFPDNEFSEYVLWNTNNGNIAGIQVKCIEISPTVSSAYVSVRLHSFVPTPNTYVVVFVLHEGGDFHQTCLLIPSADIAKIATVDGDRYRFSVTPDHLGGGLQPYATARAMLASRLGDSL